MTSEQFNPEHYMQALVSSFSVSADNKITTSSDSRKVKYDKTNPIPADHSEAAQKKMLNMTKRTQMYA